MTSDTPTPEPIRIQVPKLSLVVLVGASGAGKSTFAREHFLPTEVVSSDVCRGLVSDDENDLGATRHAFDLVHDIIDKRLAIGRLTVVDATSVRAEDRRAYVELAKKHHVFALAIVFKMRDEVCHGRNAERPDRQFGPHVVRKQNSSLRRGLRGLRREGFRRVWTLESPEDVARVTVERERMWTDRTDELGPFDIVGDVHGCWDELADLLGELGHGLHAEPGAPEGSVRLEPAVDGNGRPRRIVFVGDLVDRGPKTPAVLRFAMEQSERGHVLCVPGNHDVKLAKKLQGRGVRVSHGLAESIEQLEREPQAFVDAAKDYLAGLVSHMVLDEGRLVVAHAGIKEEMQGRSSGAARGFCLYGDTSGEVDEFGFPVRHDWAAEYRGSAAVVYGHTPTPEPEWVNGTACIDTGAVFGGRLTALRWPERDFVSVPARETYYEPIRPMEPTPAEGLTVQQRLDDTLHAADVRGKRLVDTALMHRITIAEANTAAALEVMSRFAANPKWLVHLPPTMSPSETSEQGSYLEHPAEAFAHFRSRGVARVVCQRKHMGSRAIVVVCRDTDVARERFGVTDGEAGIVTTRTGRRFFADAETERTLLVRLRAACDAEGLWDELATGWLVLDAELMPWSEKARALVRGQYAAVGAAGTSSLTAAAREARLAAERLGAAEATDLAERLETGARDLGAYRAAYRGYCWDVTSVDDLRLAPFHVLASEGRTHFDRDHRWHVGVGARLARHDAVLMETEQVEVDLAKPADEASATAWWQRTTGEGSEGMVVKPLEFIARGPNGLVQPALKCRGPEYLRIIYGPHYRAPDNLARLRQRSLGRKRSLALREFALGVEALERFVRREPLRRVHECVFGVLALESEPVDPRL